MLRLSIAVLLAMALVLLGTDLGKDFLARRSGRWLAVDRVISVNQIERLQAMARAVPAR